MIAAVCSLNRVAAAAAVQLDHIVLTARCAAARCRCATLRRCTTRECHTLTAQRQLHSGSGWQHTADGFGDVYSMQRAHADHTLTSTQRTSRANVRKARPLQAIDRQHLRRTMSTTQYGCGRTGGALKPTGMRAVCSAEQRRLYQVCAACRTPDTGVRCTLHARLHSPFEREHAVHASTQRSKPTYVCEYLCTSSVDQRAVHRKPDQPTMGCRAFIQQCQIPFGAALR
jgi:hypothetical protein